MNRLELFDEGTLTLSNIATVTRFYNKSQTQDYIAAQDYFTKIAPINKSPRATVIILHDFARTSAHMFELALQLVLNGYVCLLPDLEGQGYSTGIRVSH